MSIAALKARAVWVSAPVWPTLERAYATPPRAYHSLEHIEEVAHHFDAVAAGPGWKKPNEVFAAVLFHDAIYEAGAHDNEERSAALMREQLSGAGLNLDFAAQLISLTAQHGRLDGSGLDADAKHFLDADMAILGSSPERFERYGHQIRQEYASVPDELYTFGRRAFLEKVLASPRIYFSDFFFERFEAAARRNLTSALAS